MTDRAIQPTQSTMDSRDPIAPLSATNREHGMGLYKPGQGYWTRVGTAIGLLLLLLSGVAWVVQQCNLVPIPVSSWTLSVSAAPGPIAAGSTAKILSETKAGEPAVVVGTGTVVSVESGTGGRQAVSLDQVSLTGS